MSQNECVEIHFTLTTPDAVFMNKICFLFLEMQKEKFETENVHQCESMDPLCSPPFMCNYLWCYDPPKNTRRKFLAWETPTQMTQQRHTNMYQTNFFILPKWENDNNRKTRRKKTETKPNERTNRQLSTISPLTCHTHFSFHSFIYL